MISSLKKSALDEQVSKFINSQLHEQTILSEQRFMKIKNTPQTTKNNSHKCHVKKNLFNQHKENIPESCLTIQSNLDEYQKQKTIKFITQKSLQEKKENFQLFFNSFDGQDFNKSTATILKQKQQITQLMKMLTSVETQANEQNIVWQQEKQVLMNQLTELRDQNFSMKHKILEMKNMLDERAQSRKPSLDNDLDRLMFRIEAEAKDKIQIQENEEDTVISRICTKVQRLEEQLQYFIDLSRKFKQQTIELKHIIREQKQKQLVKQIQFQQSQEQLSSLKQTLFAIKQTHKQQVQSLSQQQTILKNQLTSYKDEYQILKKRYFIMQGEFRKYSTSLQANQEQNLKEKYQTLIRKYNCLYQSYKSLYEEYINRSRETDFVMELGESNQRQLKTMDIVQQGRKFVKSQPLDEFDNKLLFRFAKESLSDCSDITKPLEHLDQREVCETYHPRIILKDLIKETLNSSDSQVYH